MSFTNLLYHVVYATKERAPLISSAFAPQLHRKLGGIVHDQAIAILASFAGSHKYF
ncbi:MAG TPA: hypothetical protein VJT50_03475 [Pyrinomonadaceae bacterium]|nr:hypothetical protein [Pyrinomonadaceae bacterium]